MTAPERIWTWVDQLGRTRWREGNQMGQPASAVEYVRADTHREAALQYLSDTGQMMERIADLTAANMRLAAECARLKGREAEARNTLQAISDAQVPDQPATSPLSEADYVRRHFAYLRSAARAYLAGGAE